MKRVAVIGGGITGLAAAWRLQQTAAHTNPSFELRVFEASSYAGTSIRSEQRDGFLLEYGPDCFLSQKPRGVGLARELGLESELIGTRLEFRRSFIWRGERLHPIPEGFYLLAPSRTRPFLESRLLSWRGKWRALMEPLISARRSGGDESLGSFVRRRFGQEMLDWLAQPLVAGIYGADPEHLSLRATFPQFQEMEEKYGSVLLGLKKTLGRQSSNAVGTASGARYSLFVSFKHGIQTLTNALEERLGSTVLQKNVSVESLARRQDQWELTLSTGAIWNADAVVVALPAYAGARLLRGIDRDLSAELSEIPYAPAATVNFAFRESDLGSLLDGVGFVIPRHEARFVSGGTYAHHKFEGRAPKGYGLIRAFIGGLADMAWMSWNDEQLATETLSELKRFLPITGQPQFFTVGRWTQALPQYPVGHVARLLRIEDRVVGHKTLALAGNWGRGVGIPDCIASGEQAADRVWET